MEFATSLPMFVDLMVSAEVCKVEIFPVPVTVDSQGHTVMKISMTALAILARMVEHALIKSTHFSAFAQMDGKENYAT